MPSFIPLHSHTCRVPAFDFYAFYYRDTLHTNSYTMESPWLDEAARTDPSPHDSVVVNRTAGEAKGLGAG